LGKLLDQVEYVVGVDTHKDSHTAAAVDTHGGASGYLKVPTDAFGNRRLLDFAREHSPGRRVWAIEGTGSFGAGLTTFLLE
jgi:transposase